MYGEIPALLSTIGNMETQRSMQHTITDEINRQKGYASMMAPIFQTSLDASSPKAVKTDLAAGTAKREAGYGKLQSTQPTYGGTQNAADAAAADRSGKWASMMNPLRAKNAAWSDIPVSFGLKDAEAVRNLGLINQYSQQSAAAMPYQMQQASHAGDQWQMFADIGNALLGSYASAAPQAFTGGYSAVGNPSQAAYMGSMNVASQNLTTQPSTDFLNTLD